MEKRRRGAQWVGAAQLSSCGDVLAGCCSAAAVAAAGALHPPTHRSLHCLLLAAVPPIVSRCAPIYQYIRAKSKIARRKAGCMR